MHPTKPEARPLQAAVQRRRSKKQQQSGSSTAFTSTSGLFSYTTFLIKVHVCLFYQALLTLACQALMDVAMFKSVAREGKAGLTK